MADEIRTERSIPVLDMAKTLVTKIAELSGTGDRVSYYAGGFLRTHPNPESTYVPKVDILSVGPTLGLSYLATIVYGSGRSVPFTPEEALSGTSNYFRIQSDVIKVTPELIEQVLRSLGL